MIKSANPQYPIHELFANRWSPRSFSEKELNDEQMNSLFEAARWSYSAFNYQPWTFYYSLKNNSESFNKIVDCLAPPNQAWAKNAAGIVVCLAKKNVDNGTFNNWAQFDLGAAVMSLSLQALSMDIFVHPMAGFSVEKVVEVLNINSEEYNTLVILACGYLGDADKLEEPMKTREISPRTRKSISEFVNKL